MLKFIIKLSIFLFVLNIHAQYTVIKEDNVKIKFVRSRKASKVFTATNVIIKSREVKQVFVKVKVKTVSKKRELFDPNKFSLVDHNNKKRYRASDSHYQAFTAWLPFGYISKKEPKDKYKNIYYRPEIEDSFLNYEFEGIKNCEVPINLGTRKRPDYHVMHFYSKKLTSKSLMLYFPISKLVKKATLYYGNEKIGEAHFN